MNFLSVEGLHFRMTKGLRFALCNDFPDIKLACSLQLKFSCCRNMYLSNYSGNDCAPMCCVRSDKALSWPMLWNKYLCCPSSLYVETATINVTDYIWKWNL